MRFVLLLGLVFTFIETVAAEAECVFCSSPLSDSSSRPGKDDPCTDLFAAACLDPSGKSKNFDANTKLINDLKEFVENSYDVGARALGYESLEDALRAKFKEAGIEVVNSNYLNENPYGVESGEDELKVKVDCTAEVEKVRDSLNELQSNRNDAHIEKLEKILKDLETVQNKYREIEIKFYAKDIPNFVSGHIENKCRRFESGSYDKANNPEAMEICNRANEIRQHAVDLFRAEGSPDYTVRSEDFVRKNLFSNINPKTVPVYSNPSSSLEPPSSPIRFRRRTSAPRLTETPAENNRAVEEIYNKIRTLESYVSETCESAAQAQTAVSINIGRDLATTITSSKAVVERLLNHIYTPERRELANQIFESSVRDIRDLAGSFVKRGKDRRTISRDYGKLDLDWINIPSASAYVRNVRGVEILALDKLVESDKDLSIFADPTLSYFTGVNASYTTRVIAGRTERPAHIEVLPSLLLTLDTNPLLFQEVIGHEVAHKIGLLRGEVNGYDLSQEYQKLLDCLRQENSIKLQKGQEDESIADSLSAEVLARQINKLPKEKRRQAVISAVEYFCLSDDLEDSRFSVFCTGDHPHDFLRVSGIYGANPSLRRVMGCEKEESPKYKTCGLPTSLLDVAESSLRPRGGSQHQAPGKQ